MTSYKFFECFRGSFFIFLCFFTIILEAKKKTVSLINESDESISAVIRSVGCAKVIDKETLACEKISIPAKERRVLSTNSVASGKFELVVFSNGERYATGMVLEDKSVKTWPTDFKAKGRGIQKAIMVKNDGKEEISVLLQSAGCAKVIDGQTLVCEKKNVAAGQAARLDTQGVPTGKLELVVFKDGDRYATGKVFNNGDTAIWPKDFQMKTGGTVMLPGLSTYAKLYVRNDTAEPIRALVKRTGCADIRTEMGQTEGLLCAHEYVQPGQTQALEIKAPYKNDFKVIVFQQMQDIRGITIGVRYATDTTYKHGDTIVWPADFKEKAGFQQKADDAFRKVGILFKGIALAVGGLTALIENLKTAAANIKGMQDDLKNQKRAGDKAIVIAKMIDEVVPALTTLSKAIDYIGKYLIEPFDKDAYVKAEQASQITASIRDLVISIDKTIRDLAPVLNSIESGVKDIAAEAKA